jgi:PEP-CTERM motif
VQEAHAGDPQTPNFTAGQGLYFEFPGEGYLEIGARLGTMQYMLVDNVDSSGMFVGTEGTALVNQSLSFFYLPGTHYVEIMLEPAGDPLISVNFVASAVPEPSSWVMILGFAGLAFMACRRRNQIMPSTA